MGSLLVLPHGVCEQDMGFNTRVLLGSGPSCGQWAACGVHSFLTSVAMETDWGQEVVLPDSPGPQAE